MAKDAQVGGRAARLPVPLSPANRPAAAQQPPSPPHAQDEPIVTPGAAFPWTCLQVLFTDLGTGAAGALSPPSDVTEYYQWAWDLGARVFSESWGTASNVYDLRASCKRPARCLAARLFLVT